MKYDPNKHHRKSIRLKGYDYSSPGAYFVTICTYNGECLFGEIRDSSMYLNDFGKVVENEWWKSSEIRKELDLDVFQTMPNHIHGIVMIQEERPDPNKTVVGANGRSPLRMKPKSLSSFIAGYKSICTKRINELRNTTGVPVWQRNYHEHIIRNEEELNRIREYIINNPLKWELDKENPRNWKTDK